MTVDGHDSNMLYVHFQYEKVKNDGFTFTIEKDDEGNMTHCLWADATAGKSYQYFGDMVEWLKAMFAGPPKIIITNQDLAIGIALPNTLHRYCMWHIKNKFSERISALAYKEHYEEFKNCIWNSETPEQFEVGWVEVVMATNEDEHWVVYAVHRIKGNGSRGREVVVDKSSNHVRCSCKMFDCVRIPCRHMLAYFSRMQMEDLPNEYILWSGRNRLFQVATTLIDEAVVTEDGTQFVEELLSSGQKKLCDMKKVSEDGEGSAIQVPIRREIGLKEPLQGELIMGRNVAEVNCLIEGCCCDVGNSRVVAGTIALWHSSSADQLAMTWNVKMSMCNVQLQNVRAKVDNRSGVEQVEESVIAHWNELQHMHSKHYLPLPMRDIF
ncbi:hypothetical protein RHSIM_Rhsim09G0059900 [Rhododendron simsii]|uniref:SWIM-type domain-containing protein n=1 Tax=Rhododendron simsii TaxID=118357 RepID=A0A834GGB3_RHOSS|nr:hypothetical protein RHSIM_Rhsim09G0059900 [Rhododendron simsii]